MNMRPKLLLTATLAVVAVIPSAQRAEYPATLIAPGKGPYTFAEGYQTPWDRIEIRVTEKMSPNLFVLHGSEGLDPAHPEASGGRALVLFGSDGVLMVDTQNKQVAEQTLKAIRSLEKRSVRHSTCISSMSRWSTTARKPCAPLFERASTLSCAT